MAELQRYARQMALPEIGADGQAKLLERRVIIVGCGALGTVSANLLARAGVGQLVIIDRDFVELDNLQRQVLFDEHDAREAAPKALRAAEKLKEVNSAISIEGRAEHLSPANAEALISGADLILDATDNFLTRMVLNDAALKLNLPWIHAAVLGHFGMTMNILPGKTPCYRCLLEQPPPPGALPTCETAGVLAPVAHMVASLQVIEALKYLTGNYAAMSQVLLYLDGWDNTLERVALKPKTDCSACVRHEWIYLNPAGQLAAASLCGSDAVQVLPGTPGSIALEVLAGKLEKLGEVKLTPYLLRFTLGAQQFSVFADGRAIIKGVKDEAQALSLYSKYIGY